MNSYTRLNDRGWGFVFLLSLMSLLFIVGLVDACLIDDAPYTRTKMEKSK